MDPMEKEEKDLLVHRLVSRPRNHGRAQGILVLPENIGCAGVFDLE